VPPDPPQALRRLPEQYFTRLLAATAAARELSGPRLLDLGRGNPDLPPPEHALEAVRAAVAEAAPAVHGYPPFGGRPQLREAIARRYAADHGVQLDPEREVAVVPGTKTGIVLVAVATAGTGDDVLVPDPGYPDYLSGVALAGARSVALRLDPAAAFQPDLGAAAALRPALTILNYPANPCATCERPGTFEAAVAFTRERAGLAAARPRLRRPSPSTARSQRPGCRRRARGRVRAVVAVEDLRDGGLADRLPGRQRALVGAGCRAHIDHADRRGLLAALQRGLGGRRSRATRPRWPPGGATLTRRRATVPRRPAAARAERGDRRARGDVLAWWWRPARRLSRRAPAPTRRASGVGARGMVRAARAGQGAAVARDARRRRRGVGRPAGLRRWRVDALKMVNDRPTTRGADRQGGPQRRHSVTRRAHEVRDSHQPQRDPASERPTGRSSA
jgi:hypothetical protein